MKFFMSTPSKLEHLSAPVRRQLLSPTPAGETGQHRRVRSVSSYEVDFFFVEDFFAGTFAGAAAGATLLRAASAQSRATSTIDWSVSFISWNVLTASAFRPSLRLAMPTMISACCGSRTL